MKVGAPLLSTKYGGLGVGRRVYVGFYIRHVRHIRLGYSSFHFLFHYPYITLMLCQWVPISPKAY